MASSLIKRFYRFRNFNFLLTMRNCYRYNSTIDVNVLVVIDPEFLRLVKDQVVRIGTWGNFRLPVLAQLQW